MTPSQEALVDSPQAAQVAGRAALSRYERKSSILRRSTASAREAFTPPLPLALFVSPPSRPNKNAAASRGVSVLPLTRVTRLEAAGVPSTASDSSVDFGSDCAPPVRVFLRGPQAPVAAAAAASEASGAASPPGGADSGEVSQVVDLVFWTAGQAPASALLGGGAPDPEEGEGGKERRARPFSTDRTLQAREGVPSALRLSPLYALPPSLSL